MSSLNVLHVSPTYYPATYWGGPVFSTRDLADGIAAEPDIELKVLTTDAAGPNPSDRLPIRRRRFPAGYDVVYTRRIAGRDTSPGLLARLLPAVARADIVHLTATYCFPTLPTLLASRLLGRPVVWSPRGAIQARMEWSEAQSRRKVAFERVARILAPAATVIHATAPVEAELTARAMPGMRVELVPNSVRIPTEPSGFVRREPGERPLRLMFLSRLHAKKGLELLLKALAGLPGPILDVYGGGTADYLAALHAEVGRLGLTERVTFHGHVDGAAREAAYRTADLFVLPSHSENFGNAVAEALAYGVPVVTTTATPWREVETRGCGAWVAPDAEAIRAAIARLAPRDLAAMGRIGRAYMTDAFSPAAVTRDMLRLYHSLAATRQRARSLTPAGQEF